MKDKAGLPRAIEFSIALGGLTAITPLLAVVAALIKITSPGPVFFCQKRVGLNGTEFTLYKFRTMRIRQTGPLVTAASDSRITRIGRFLRKTKLDETPGLWNVVRGDMSFVGPRPEVPQMVNLEDGIWREILAVRPGITDPVTLRLRNEEELLSQVDDKEGFYREVLQPYKLAGYLKFVRKKSPKTDLKIILQTLLAVVFPSTAPPPTLDEVRGDFIESF